MTARVPIAPLLLALACSSSCRPQLDDRPWLITAPQILGWRAEPPEVRPGGSVALQIVALDPAGPADTSAAAWSLCRVAKPLDENRPVAAGCLAPTATDATGDPVMLAIPTDACRLFGPDTPQPAPGAPPTRPRDADATGGYYQPVTIAFGAALAVGLERVTCGLPDASLAVARAFQDAYRPNQNPTISSLSFAIAGTPIDPTTVPPGARVTIDATLAAGSAETFPVFDRGSRSLVTTTETLRASWYVTAGELEQAGATSAAWIAPAAAGGYEIVLVLRDSRGGMDAARVTMIVP